MNRWALFIIHPQVLLVNDNKLTAFTFQLLSGAYCFACVVG